FLAKVHTYQLYFNLARPNSHKENQTPWQIIERLAPRSPLELCLLPPVFLDDYLNDSGGYDVPRLPFACLHFSPHALSAAQVKADEKCRRTSGERNRFRHLSAYVDSRTH
ncbi:MAG: hypothetical protein ACRD4C_03255, partial [Candidatus Acidiferrales bacterium]